MKDFDAVVDRMFAERQRPVVLTGPGCRLALSPRGARVMAVAADGLPHDPFFLGEDGNGELTGGDRLWLGPEVAWFWPSLEQAREDPVKHAAVPAAIDPGSYGVESSAAGRASFVQRFALEDSRDEAALQGFAHREIRLLPRPGGDLDDGVSAVAYATEHSLGLEETLPPWSGAVASMWSIAQVPPGGTLVCPTTRELCVADDVTSYYDDFGPDHVRADGRAVRFRIDARRRIKMGLKPEDTAGRMGYFRPLGDGRASLILRFFPTLPGETYCDLPRSAPAAQRSGGDCLQAYNDDLTYGEFGEMEHHDPAVVVGGVENQSHSSTTMILGGPEADVRAAGERLLGVSV